MSKGFIKLNRKFFETDYWEQERTFSFAEAWLDLIQSARFEANPQEKTLKNGREITVKRGEIHASLRYLSNRWRWSVGKVKRFIDKCVKKQQIEQRTEQGETILKLCKYKDYNNNNKPKKNTDEHTDRHTDGTPIDTPTEQNKEYKEREDIKNKQKVFDDFKKMIGENNEQYWREVFYMQYKIKKGQLHKILDEFKNSCILNGVKSPEDLNQYKKHFFNWCNKREETKGLDKYKTVKRKIGDL